MMRRNALYHLAGIAILFLYFVYLLSGILMTILEDVTPYELSKQELQELTTSNPQPDQNRTEWIPKIIHQVYLGWDNEDMPESWRRAQKSCIDMHPEYKYMFWTNESTTDLIIKEFPWFLKTYEGYRFPIQRADSIRYLILAQYGGIYIDLDNGCQRKLDPLLFYPAWMPGTKIRVGLTNHVMAASKGHPYFALLVKSLQSYDYNYLLPYLTVMNSAGPHFVSIVWERYLRITPQQEVVRILSQAEYSGQSWSFFTKEKGGTWNGWDTAIFKFVGAHLNLIVIFCLICLCLVSSCIWWLGWKLLSHTKPAEKRRSVQLSSLPLWQKSA